MSGEGIEKSLSIFRYIHIPIFRLFQVERVNRIMIGISILSRKFFYAVDQAVGAGTVSGFAQGWRLSDSELQKEKGIAGEAHREI
jgi:hypothetical protein